MGSRLVGARAGLVVVLGLGLGLVLGAGCTSVAAPRPQLVVVVDTDLPVVDQIRSHPELSNDAAMDSLRIDILDENNHPFHFIDVTVADPLDWPVSFGVQTNDQTSVRLRVRLFRAQHATPGELNHLQTLEPDAAGAIDRIIDAPLPASGVSRIEVMLAGDCLGVRPSFAVPPRSCIDGAHLSAVGSEGIVTASAGAPSDSRIGTWAPAKESACSKASSADRICIPGGFSLLGDVGLKGLADGIAIRVDTAPLRPVRLSPFYLDKTEVTVGEFDALRASHPASLTEALPGLKSSSPFCTWLGGDAGNEKRPLNCVTREAAAQICMVRGGGLPTEAQWEHAARGRGERRLYPWGSTSPSDCCVAAVDCTLGVVEPVGSHPAGTSRCGGVGDVSRDGVVDMGGSVREHVRDRLAAYDAPCWSGAGILVDPVCTVDPSTAFVARGGAFGLAATTAIAALRQTDLAGNKLADVGVRCAYPDGAP